MLVYVLVSEYTQSEENGSNAFVFSTLEKAQDEMAKCIAEEIDNIKDDEHITIITEEQANDDNLGCCIITTDDFSWSFYEHGSASTNHIDYYIITREIL